MIELTPNQYRKVNETLSNILNAIKRGSIDGHYDNAFNEGYKIFVHPSNSLDDNLADIVKKRLLNMDINSEIVINGMQGASWVTRCFLVWRIIK